MISGWVTGFVLSGRKSKEVGGKVRLNVVRKKRIECKMVRRNPRTSKPPMVSPSVTPQQGIKLLQRQSEKGASLLENRPLKEEPYDFWTMVTGDYLVKAFGSDSPHVDKFLVHRGRKVSAYSGDEGPAGVRPLERLGQSAVEVFDERHNPGWEVLYGGEAGALVEIAQGRDPADQGFGLMRVEVVDDENSLPIQVGAQ